MTGSYRIGIDVGGTNTDAVILEFGSSNRFNSGVVASEKVPTTPDVTYGIEHALRQVLSKSVSLDEIAYLSIGTTHFVNAVVQADTRCLAPVAVIRLSGPYTVGCPPFIDFPPILRGILEGHTAFIDGGLQVDGKEIVPIRDDQIKEQCEIIAKKDIRNVALVGVFSSLAKPGTQEEYVREVILETLGKGTVNVVCSKDVGNIGFLERENSTILNAAILDFARRTISSYRKVLSRMKITCPLFLTQLDGTLLSADLAAAVPIRTFSNGPTNSMRGASFLAGLGPLPNSVVVADVGGTTTDVGVILPSGFPRKAAAFTQIAGVRTSASMPDVYSIGLGGGSRVRFPSTGSAKVGPDSVGHNINREALAFGGDTLTATDVALAAGIATSIGESDRVVEKIQGEQVNLAINNIQHQLESAIDRMKTDPGDVVLILVGGGSIIAPNKLRGVSEIIRPAHFDVANAVGAALARISGTVDRVEIPGGRSTDEIISKCKEDAIVRAVSNGAARSSVSVAEVETHQLPYIANKAFRVVVRAVGDLDFNALQKMKVDETGMAWSQEIVPEDVQPDLDVGPRALLDPVPVKENELLQVNPSTYNPSISRDGVWSLTETDLEWMADGCAVLGCGGGGAPYPVFLMARESLRKGATIRVVDVNYFKDPNAHILPCGFMGSPSVSAERLQAGTEIPNCCENVMKLRGLTEVAALISDEIGGKNGMEPMLVSSRTGLSYPVVDGDLMGRAYPKLNQIIPSIYDDKGLCPAVGSDGMGNCIVVPVAQDNATVEDIFRAACTVLGSSIGLSIASFQVKDLKRFTIQKTISQAWRIGRAIAECRLTSNLSKVASAITELQGGKCLFRGKIVDLKREVSGGFTHGQITVAPLSKDELEGPETTRQENNRKVLVIPFQNENLRATLVSEDGSKETLCSVPDLIAVLDSQNGASIGTPDYRYGLRVTVIGLACDDRWKTSEGLKIGGPEAFGFDIPYVPIGSYREPKSVIEEYLHPEAR